MGLTIGLGGGNAGGGGGVVASGLIQDMEGVKWTGTVKISDTTITEFPGADCRDCTSLAGMFSHCNNLVSVGFLKNTGKVDYTGSMFQYCSSLQTAPEFDTYSVTNMSYMFQYCSKLQTVPLFDTSAVIYMSNMFDSCYLLQTVPSFDTSSVSDMYKMFYSCSKLTEVPLFNTSAVTNMGYMFSYCSSLQTVPAFDTSAVTNMSYMFNQCSLLQTVPAFDTSAVTKMDDMFYCCYALTSIGGTLNMIKVTSDSNASSMFGYCQLLETVQISNLGVSLDLSYCKVLSVDSVLFLFNNAQSGVSGKTIQLNSLVFDQLTEDQIAIATEKGFSVTSVVRS